MSELVCVGTNYLTGMADGIPIDARRTVNDSWFQVMVVHNDVDHWISTLTEDDEQRNRLIDQAAERDFLK